MTVSVEIPDLFAKRYGLDEPCHTRQLLEAFVLQRYAEGDLSAGQVEAALGLSFHEAQSFLHVNGAPGLGIEDHVLGLKNLERLRSND